MRADAQVVGVYGEEEEDDEDLDWEETEEGETEEETEDEEGETSEETEDEDGETSEETDDEEDEEVDENESKSSQSYGALSVWAAATFSAFPHSLQLLSIFSSSISAASRHTSLLLLSQCRHYFLQTFVCFSFYTLPAHNCNLVYLFFISCQRCIAAACIIY